MFEPNEKRVFALGPGVDFPSALIDGLRLRLSDQPPEAMAHVELVVNTTRMARRLQTIFQNGPPGFLPKISVLTELQKRVAHKLPHKVAPLRRRLELEQLVRHLIRQQRDLAPEANAIDLADSLAELLDECQSEGVDPAALAKLDVSDMSGHWQRSLAFIKIAATGTQREDGALDPEAYQRLAVETLSNTWRETPPLHPIILAGSTGSRGSTLALMKAVARLPNGAIVLPGFDFGLSPGFWADMKNALVYEDHPQFRFQAVMTACDVAPSEVTPWVHTRPEAPERNQIVSLALHPAPVTHRWMTDGPQLPDISDAFRKVTLVEAPDARSEASAIALRMRAAKEAGQSVALITPDRMLTRQVTSALTRWGLVPDDSAGSPLHLSPPGRLLRHVADSFVTPMTPDRLLAVLKHPLTHVGADRGWHLLFTRELELFLRRTGPPKVDLAILNSFVDKMDADGLSAWVDWLAATFLRDQLNERQPQDWLRQLVHAAEQAVAGSSGQVSDELWARNSGEQAKAVVKTLQDNAGFGGPLGAFDFARLIQFLLSRESVRDRDAPDPDLMIWGTMEARVQGAELLILGGLNEGAWPEVTQADPWLNRALRHQAGLLLPERRTGLAAHDFQQAIAAKEVWLTRAKRNDDADTVPSRWINRLTNLMSGLPVRNGPTALRDMRARGDTWCAWAAALDDSPRVAPAPRPSPCPPVHTRPRQLSVTEIKKLIRDPYAIYAKHVLRLKPLDALVNEPDALTRGVVLHRVLETFTRARLDGEAELTAADLLTQARQVLARDVPWATAERLWLAMIARFAPWFIQQETKRNTIGHPVLLEGAAALAISDPEFRLVGVADRIDRVGDAGLAIYDYKSGGAPTKKEQDVFDKQLLLEAAMVERGAFDALPPDHVVQAIFIGLSRQIEVAAPLLDNPADKVLEDLRKLIGAYLVPDQGFSARRMMQKDEDESDYDHLSRFGEWSVATPPSNEALD